MTVTGGPQGGGICAGLQAAGCPDLPFPVTLASPGRPVEWRVFRCRKFPSFDPHSLSP